MEMLIMSAHGLRSHLGKSVAKCVEGRWEGKALQYISISPHLWLEIWLLVIASSHFTGENSSIWPADFKRAEDSGKHKNWDFHFNSTDVFSFSAPLFPHSVFCLFCFCFSFVCLFLHTILFSLVIFRRSPLTHWWSPKSPIWRSRFSAIRPPLLLGLLANIKCTIWPPEFYHTTPSSFHRILQSSQIELFVVLSVTSHFLTADLCSCPFLSLLSKLASMSTLFMKHSLLVPTGWSSFILQTLAQIFVQDLSNFELESQ